MGWIKCQFCGDEFPDFDVAHVCSSGKYVSVTPRVETPRVMWFSGRSCVGIVRVVDPYDGVKYYIGSPPMSDFSSNREEDDIQWIVDWGASFPTEIGQELFSRYG